MAKRINKSSVRKMTDKQLSSVVSKNMQTMPTPHGGDVLDPFSVPQPGDNSSKLFSNEED